MTLEETTLTEDIQCQPWRQKRKQKQNKMVDNYKRSTSKSYLVESFVLNSPDRVISKKGEGRRPNPSYSSTSTQQLLRVVTNGSGKKVQEVDLQVLGSHFDRYVHVVNLVLSKIYNSDRRAQLLGKKLSEYRGRAHSLLRKEQDLNYQHNKEIKDLVFERLYRNALEHAGRTLLSDWTRRQLFNVAIEVISKSSDDVLKLLRRKRIPSDLIRKVRDMCETTKNNGSGWHHTLGILRQLKLALDRHVLENEEVKISWRGRQRKFVSSFLQESSSDKNRILTLLEVKIKEWVKKGYPFTVPYLRRQSLDFSASTENSPGQGYWFTLDEERENEILFHIKLPPGIDGTHHEDSPFKGKTLTLQFLDWMPRAAIQDRKKAQRVEDDGDHNRAQRLEFRAAMFEDMNQQLRNTIKIQTLTHRLSRLRQKKDSDTEEIIAFQTRIKELRSSRRSAPPRLLLRDGRVTLQIPFLAPDDTLIKGIFGDREYTAKAGVDRGIRVPVVLSVMRGKEYRELLLRVERLVGKREFLRKQAYRLQSVTDRKRNNWDRKRKGQRYPGHIMKKDRHIAALWRKIRRLDREISRVVASKTVWFCEAHGVKTLFFEDLRSFQAHAGSKDLSYNLSSNLWGRIIDTVRYMRQSLGHSRYGVWTVNPQYTSQTCHVCGERGIRVEDEHSVSEKKGGEYFYCDKCDEHHHADVNAARNIIHVHPGPSVVAGRII
ncbi:MAG: transposase [Candidatus Thorarchaeota archaeon]